MLVDLLKYRSGLYLKVKDWGQGRQQKSHKILVADLWLEGNCFFCDCTLKLITLLCNSWWLCVRYLLQNRCNDTYKLSSPLNMTAASIGQSNVLVTIQLSCERWRSNYGATSVALFKYAISIISNNNLKFILQCEVGIVWTAVSIFFMCVCPSTVCLSAFTQLNDFRCRNLDWHKYVVYCMI